MENKFEQQLSQLDIRLTERQKEQFHQYYELLVEWNKVMNLTGITEYAVSYTHLDVYKRQGWHGQYSLEVLFYGF